MEALIAGWVGSTNLGDELVHAGVRRLCAATGLDRLTVISTRPTATEALHGPVAVGHTDLPAVARAAGRADLLVFGGGGLVQDLTSPFNLPYHLSRPWLARRRRTPWVGLALGADALRSRVGRRLAGYLRTAAAIGVRDQASADVLASAGVSDVTVTADAALANPAPEVEVEDVVVVSLRPWAGGGGRLPVALQRTDRADWLVTEAATALDHVATTTGLPVRLVALQTDRDHRLHLQVAERMRTDVECLQPGLDDVIASVARGRVVVAMRYHAAISAVLGARPFVAIGYSSKVHALAEQAGGAPVLPFAPGALSGLASAVAAALDADPVAAVEARARLTIAAQRNVEVLERGLPG